MLACVYEVDVLQAVCMNYCSSGCLVVDSDDQYGGVRPLQSCYSLRGRREPDCCDRAVGDPCADVVDVAGN